VLTHDLQTGIAAEQDSQDVSQECMMAGTLMQRATTRKHGVEHFAWIKCLGVTLMSDTLMLDNIAVARTCLFLQWTNQPS
jgi:hypothetical protein